MRPILDLCWRLALRIAFVLFSAYCAIARPRVRSAHVLVWDGQRLLVVRHSYKRGLSAPAGMIHAAESGAEGAARELGEEVGLHVDAASLRAVTGFETEREHARDSVHVFEVDLERADANRTGVVIDRREIVWAGFLTLDAVRRERLRPIFAEILDRPELRERFAGAG